LIIKPYSSIIRSLEVTFSLLRKDAAQNQERSKGTDNADQLCPFSLSVCSFKRDTNRVAFAVEQFILFFVCLDIVGDMSNEAVISFVLLRLRQVDVSIV